MDSEPNGIPIVIGAKRINPLAINLARVVIEVLLYVEHVVTESRQFYRRKHMVKPFMAQGFINALLHLKVHLLLIVINARKPRHHDPEVLIQNRRLIGMRVNSNQTKQ